MKDASAKAEHDYSDEDENLGLSQQTSRRYILIFYWVVVLLVVPYWWKATSIERQSIPEERVKEQTGRLVRIGLLTCLAKPPTNITSSARLPRAHTGRRWSRASYVETGSCC